VYQHDGSDKSQEESGENVGGSCGHVRAVLLSSAPDELVEVKLIIKYYVYDIILLQRTILDSSKI